MWAGHEALSPPAGKPAGGDKAYDPVIIIIHEVKDANCCPQTFVPYTQFSELSQHFQRKFQEMPDRGILKTVVLICCSSIRLI